MNRRNQKPRKRRVLSSRAGECRYYVSGDVILVVKNNAIVTVMRRDWR